MPRNAKRGGGDGFGLKYSQKAADDTIDDNFNDATNQSGPVNGLASKWTVTQGTNTTVPLYFVGGGFPHAYYDLSAAKRARFFMAGGVAASTNQIFWRQTFTLGEGESVLSSWSLGILGRDQSDNPGWRSYLGFRGGISLTDNLSGPRSGNYVSCGWKAYNDTWNASGLVLPSYHIGITSSSNSDGTDDITHPALTQSSNAIFRISRRASPAGYTMHAASGDSDSWHQVRSTTYPGSSTLTYLWIELWPPTGTLSSDIGLTCNWIRKGVDDYDPWSYQ